MSSSGVSRAVPTVSAERAHGLGNALWIDLRSPAEYAEDHVPGAASVPLFNDEERALIGTLYARRSPEAAFEEGRRRTRQKIGELVRAVASLAGVEEPRADLEERVEAMTAGGLARLDGELGACAVERPPDRPIVFYCWRGGLRSRSVVAILREVGFEDAIVLDGGYKSHRRLVRERIAAWEAPPITVLRGLTGVGKTLVLRELEGLREGWTLDLEGLAGHRSSILGMVGLEPRSQKAFESRLFARLERGFPGVCVMEGESRKVGDVILPDRVWGALDAGTNVELTASLARRVEVLIDDYLEREENRAELRERLPFIEDRLGARKWGGVLVGLLDERRDAELVELLLEHYYDPLYRRSEKGRHYHRTIEADDPREAARRVAEWVEAGSPGAGSDA